jgi:formylglycine-generating enzyme required for sulfatase activity
MMKLVELRTFASMSLLLALGCGCGRMLSSTVVTGESDPVPPSLESSIDNPKPTIDAGLDSRSDADADADAPADSIPTSCREPLMCGERSCCESLDVPGGSFVMGSSDGVNASPSHVTSLSSFRLDTFEVTVGRFRRFVDQYSGAPTEGTGAHPLAAGTGWRAEWNDQLPSSRSAFSAALLCPGPPVTWSDAVGPKENRPIVCSTWYEAFAFCVWDGGRLPSEAEWEYAAAGGSADEPYPWGAASPDTSRALYNFAPIGDVGSLPAGMGRFGQTDLSGNVWEWVFDAFAPYDAGTCDDCVRLTGPKRVFRGGSWYSAPGELNRTWRDGREPITRTNTFGFRCAR